MSQDMDDLIALLAPSCELLALGEPTHQEPAFGRARNEFFAQLVERGFRSIALETDRVAALAVNDFVQAEPGDSAAEALDAVLRDGFSHGFGAHSANRQLVSWMRRHNQSRPPEDRLAFHGFDAPLENTSAPSPRRYLEHAHAYLRRHLDAAFDLDLGLRDDLSPRIASLSGDDERWSRAEAVLDAAVSPGDTGEAEQLRVIADDLLVHLHAHAPELIAATSRAAWHSARTHLTAGIDVLRYHKQASRPGDRTARMHHLLGTRDALMARNLLDIRAIEADRGPTLVFAHNLHLQRAPNMWRMGDTDVRWNGAGTVVDALLGERYAFVVGSLGRSPALRLDSPAPDTYEGALQRHLPTWGVTAPATALAPQARSRTDTAPQQGYFPLTEDTLATSDAVLHIGHPTTV